MKIMLAMLVSLLELLDQIVVEEAKSVLGVLKDLLTKLGGERGEVWLGELKKFCRGESCWIKVFKTYVVNCADSLADMIKLAGFESGQFNTDITEDNFPMENVGAMDEWEFKVFWFGENGEGVSSKSAKEKIEKEDIANPWQVARIKHLLTYARYNRNEQLEYPIIALGSVGEVSGVRHVPCLDGCDSERSLGLYWWGYEWGALCRFLAVRKVSRTSAS